MILATVAIGLAVIAIQQARHEWRTMAATFTELDRAEKIFPHPNEKARPFQRRN